MTGALLSEAMHWILFRHGVAIAREAPNCPADPDRALTEKGHRRTRAAVRGLGQLGIRPGVVLSSSYRRSLETADHVIEQLGAAHRIESPALEPIGSPAECEVLLLGLEVEQVLIAGHAPQLDGLAEYLLGTALPPLKKAGAIWLARRPSTPDADLTTPDREGRSLRGVAELRAWLSPRCLRSLADELS